MTAATYFTLLIACCAYALWKGGAPERWGVAILCLSVAASGLLPSSLRFRFREVELGFLAIDTLMLLCICVLAVRAQRYWPMVIAAILIDQILTHLLMYAPTVMPFSYGVMTGLWSFAKPPLLAAATVRHRQRLAIYGSDPDWS